MPESAVSDFVRWTRWFVLFNGKRHPRELGLSEVGLFLQAVVQREPEPLVALDRARRLATARRGVQFWLL